MNLDTLLSDAKEQLVARKTIFPTLYLELSEPEEVHIIVLQVINDHLNVPEQAGKMFNIGVEEGRKHKDQRLKSITFVAETWATRGLTVGARYTPKDDPARRETLTIEEYNPEKGSHLLVTEIKRGANRTVLEFLETEHYKRHIPGEQTDAFYKGFLLRHMSDNEVERLLINTIANKIRR